MNGISTLWYSSLNGLLMLFSHSIAIVCTTLAPDVNGVIIFTPDNTEPFDFQTTATYGCNEGFFLLGNANYDTRWCGGDGLSTSGVWNNTVPSCPGEILFLFFIFFIPANSQF